MKHTKLMVALLAVGMIVALFCMNAFMRQGNNPSTQAVDGSILKNAPGEAAETPPVAVVVPKDMAWVKVKLPKPTQGGTPKEVKGAYNLEPSREGRPREPIFVPAGCEHLLSRDCTVTSSDPDPIIGDLSYITDGDKEYDSATYVELAPGTQWVQVDLGQEREIYAICVWHNFYEPRVYRDVICQISGDPDFLDAVVTVFNNDHDNSSKLGIGKDKEYIETNEGRPFPVHAVKGRYVRFYSRGNTSNEMNHYTEIEVYGKGE